MRDFNRLARTEWMWAGALALALLWPLVAMIAPIDRDESQYLAAAELATRLRPMADFVYLQTPLQPYLAAPIAALSSSWTFLTLRGGTAAIGLLTLALVYAAQRMLGVRDRVALGSCLLLAVTHPFQFASAVVRNDIVPAMLLAGALAVALAALRGGDRRLPGAWAAVGLLVTAATATKISYALPTAAIGLFLLLRLRDAESRGWWDLAGYGAGALPAALIVLAIRHADPIAFDYGVFLYPAHGPFEWYAMNGEAERLDLPSKFADTLIALLRGPAFIALGLVAAARWRGRGARPADPALLLLDLAIAAGAIAALLPTPTWQQYVVPMLVPLFIRLGASWPDAAAIGPRARRLLAGAIAVSIAVGAAAPAGWLVKSLRGRTTPISLTEEAHRIGASLRAAGVRGEIATLSPQAVVDSGYPIDERFAAGPFFYRTGDAVSPAIQRDLNAVSRGTLERFLAAQPPAAIVTGYEPRNWLFEIDLDEDLRRFARRHGYRRIATGPGKAELYVAPIRPGGTPTSLRPASPPHQA